MARGTTPLLFTSPKLRASSLETVIGCHRPQWCFVFLIFLLFLICSKPPFPLRPLRQAVLWGWPGCLVSGEAEAGTLRP